MKNELYKVILEIIPKSLNSINVCEIFSNLQQIFNRI